MKKALLVLLFVVCSVGPYHVGFWRGEAAQKRQEAAMRDAGLRMAAPRPALNLRDCGELVSLCRAQSRMEKVKVREPKVDLGRETK